MSIRHKLFFLIVFIMSGCTSFRQAQYASSLEITPRFDFERYEKLPRNKSDDPVGYYGVNEKHEVVSIANTSFRYITTNVISGKDVYSLEVSYNDDYNGELGEYTVVGVFRYSVRNPPMHPMGQAGMEWLEKVAKDYGATDIGIRRLGQGYMHPEVRRHLGQFIDGVFLALDNSR